MVTGTFNSQSKNEFSDRSFWDRNPGYTTAISLNQSSSSAPNQSMLASLSDTNFSVSATAVSAQNVDMNASASGAQIGSNLKAVNNVKNDVQTVKADVAQTLRQAQGEVMAVTEELSMNPGEIFPNASASDAMNIATSAALEGLTGGGSLVTATASTVAVDAVFNSDETFNSQEEALSQIEQRLRDRAPASNNQASAPDQQVRRVETSFDWEQFFEDGHELADLMATDPDHPSEQLFPEIRELNTIEHNCDAVLENLQTVDVQYDGPHCAYASSSLRDLQGLTCDMSDSFEVNQQAKDATLALNNEYRKEAMHEFAGPALQQAFGKI